jgi:hypothetical protein
VVADAPGALHVSVKRRNSRGSLEATLRLEPLGVNSVSEKSNEPASLPLRPVGVATNDDIKLDDGLAGLSVMGHVAHRGDVEVAQGNWIAGPDSPSPIEGIEIRGAKTPSMQVETQSRIGARSSAWSDWAAPGAFIGTRGKRLPLTGLRFRLSGNEAKRYELDVDALFLGSPISTRRGREVELTSAAGIDPLVGLRISLRREGGLSSDVASLDSAKVSREPRVRIFRANEAR